jgi:hypothetical protein
MKTFLVMTTVQLAILTLYLAAVVKQAFQRLFQRDKNQ